MARTSTTIKAVSQGPFLHHYPHRKTDPTTLQVNGERVQHKNGVTVTSYPPREDEGSLLAAQRSAARVSE